MKIVYAHEPFPTTGEASIFLAGPTPRQADVASWRPEALRLLEKAGFKGHVFVPEGRDGVFRHGYESQVQWEEKGLHRADVILFWIPRTLDTMLGLTTNDEWGTWKASGKVVLGTPFSCTTPRVRYQRYYAEQLGAPLASSLEDTVIAALEQLERDGGSAPRHHGELAVPLFVWKSESFRAWYEDLQNAGQTLLEARVLWTRWENAGRRLFGYVLWARVYVPEEDRTLEREFFFARPDRAATVLHGPLPKNPHFLGNVEVVLVQEARVATHTTLGVVGWNLASGSAPSFEMGDSKRVALEEVHEETGVKFSRMRLEDEGIRQMDATLCVHRTHLYSIELTAAELDHFRQLDTPQGDVAADERTYVEVVTVKTLLGRDTADWSTVGMVLSVLTNKLGVIQ
jgi:hypothetical protein